MKTDQTEVDLLQNALKAFTNKTGLPANIPEKEAHAGQDPDALLRIGFQDMEFYFAVEMVPTLTRAAIGGALQQLQRFPRRGILVTQYITPQIADLLREMDVFFIDRAGNAYINEPPLFIFSKGNKLPQTYRKAPLPRTFQPAGLKLLFALLCNPGLENRPFREIAKAATVALGTVEGTMRGLKQMGFLIDMGKRGRIVTQKQDLLTRWATIYPEQLRPKQLIGRYRADSYDWWEKVAIHQFEAYWGGEVAAAKLTKYLKPQVITVYTGQPLGTLLLKNKIKKDPNGDIEILKTFWGFKHDWQHPDLVHPLLIYADLLATGDRRNFETAKIIYDKELYRFIQQD
jgi:hypothetical protein